MSDAQLAQDLRYALNDQGMTDGDIDKAIAGEIREVEIAEAYPKQIAQLKTSAEAFAEALAVTLSGQGAVWNGTVYNLNALGLSPMVKLAATEELSAIRRYASTSGFDAAKALTNLLRLIKAAER